MRRSYLSLWPNSMNSRYPSRRRERGAALVELAVALPCLLLVFAGAVDFARVFYTSIELNNAVRAGVMFGSDNLGNISPTSAIQSTATGSVNISGVTAVATATCQCYNDSAVLVSTPSCSTPAATACSGSHRVVSVTVTAT